MTDADDYFALHYALLGALTDYFSGRGASSLARRWAAWFEGLKR